ncbi:uncharacterized protein [Palaemon carinicauda]|uniref:uncharacterized protein n=1 Tax=Palaemon carinicauda TaxID=392227 RepID=UPI0035B68801
MASRLFSGSSSAAVPPEQAAPIIESIKAALPVEEEHLLSGDISSLNIPTEPMDEQVSGVDLAETFLSPTPSSSSSFHGFDKPQASPGEGSVSVRLKVNPIRKSKPKTNISAAPQSISPIPGPSSAPDVPVLSRTPPRPKGQKGQTQRHQPSLEKKSYNPITGQNIEDPLSLSSSPPTMVETGEPLQIGSSAIPSSTCDDSHRRVSQWLGGLLSTPDVSGLLVPCDATVPHQRLGGHGSVTDLKTAIPSTLHPHQDSLRQHGGSSLHQQRRIEITQSQSSPGHHLYLGKRKELVPVSHSPRRSPERDSGLTILDKTTRIGMVPGRKFLPVDFETGSRSPGRLVRDTTQPQTSLLRGPEPGPSGLRYGRTNPGLEPLEEDLPVPSGESSDESFTEATLLPRKGGFGSTSVAKKQLVSSPPRAETSPVPDPIPQGDPSGPNTDCVRFLKDSANPNFVDFMKFAAHKDADIDPENVLFIESDKRDSTIRQYDLAVKKLAEFLENSNETRMTPNLAISFFRSLFDRGLAASTITTIKSALKRIFYVGFNIDLADSYFSSIPKTCARLRPSVRPQKVTWLLNDVLKLASDTDTESCSYILLLRKTLFLMAMASGARISELAALSRNPENLDFLPSGEVLLSPDRAFLAKNEDPQNRWSPWKIIPLPEDASLCPVATLRAFLARTASHSSGPLFVREQGGTISIQGIRQQILYFIKQANPDSFPHAHDIRAVATSINYFQNMDFDDLKKYTGWKSPMVFKRHYLKNLQALKFPTVAAGCVVSPD